MLKVRTNGVELFYEESGAGEPLLLIAGFACDHTNWCKLVPLLASTSRLITFDNRGVGQSSSPETSYSIRQMAQDTIGLLDAIGLDSVHVAGHSMGGAIAQLAALEHLVVEGTVTLSMRYSGTGRPEHLYAWPR